MDDIKPLFYANDKDLFDLIISNKKKLPNHLLIEMLRENGIVISQEDDRYSIVSYISSMLLDYHFTSYLLEQTEKGQRTEKNTSLVIDENIEMDIILQAIESLRNERSAKYREVYSPMVESTESIRIPIQYEEIDFAKTKLLQKRDRQSEIQIDIIDGQVVLRGPANERGGDILSELVSSIEKVKKSPVERRRIELSGINDPSLKTKFFLQMINCLDDFKTLDVTTVKVDRDPEYDSLEGDEDEYEDAKHEMEGNVKKAMLSGQGLIYSPEFKKFTDTGFFISRIEWEAIKKTGLSPKYEFEAALDNPIEGTGYKYGVKGYYKPRDSDFSVTRYPVTVEERKSLNRLLEKSAWESLKSLVDG